MNIVTAIASRATQSALLAACVALGSAAAVQAGEACTTSAQSAHAAGPAITVRYNDLNVSTTEGARVLYTRINHAAHQVCAAPDIRDLAAQAVSAACEREAVEHAVEAVHSAQLAAMVPVKMPQG